MREKVAEVIKSCRLFLQKIGDNLQNGETQDIKLAMKEYEIIKEVMKITAGIPQTWQEYQKDLERLRK